MPEEPVAIGVDGARGGWLAACGFAAEDGTTLSHVEFHLVHHFAELEALRAGGDAPVCVDVPMGLLETGRPRPCDTAARGLLGARRASVFAAPPRQLLTAVTYEEARERIAQLQADGIDMVGISAQAFGIVPKVRDADEWLQTSPQAQQWLFECHPELSFYALIGGDTLASKNSVAGQATRISALAAEVPDLLGLLGSVDVTSPMANMTDALDALAALTTALVVRREEHKELGGETDDTGLVMRIVM